MDHPFPKSFQISRCSRCTRDREASYRGCLLQNV